MPRRHAVRLELVALGDADLRGDQIEAGHRLGHGVLDLDPRVELEEEELAPGDNELGGAGAAVVDRVRESERRLAELRPKLRIDDRRRGLLEHLLVPALDRAFPLRKRDSVTVAVPEELHLDVARRLDVALEENGVVAEGCLGLAPGRIERRVELTCRADDPHPAPTTARGRLDQQREPQARRVSRLDDRHTGLLRDPFRGELVAARPERIRRRPDPDEPGRLDRLGQQRALRQEPVPGMNRVRAGLQGRPHVLGRIEVARDRNRLPRAPRVECGGVIGLGDRYGLDPELAARSEDPHRNLSPVCDEQLANRPRAAHIRKMPKRVSGIGASSAAEIPSARARRVSSGSRIPSSQSLAVE